jgi:serine/threonine-protein kinase HipA
LKNWSVIYRDDRNPELAPAYDFVSTVGYVQNDDIGLSLAGIRQFDEISWDTWRRFAEKSRMPVHMTLQTVRDTMEKFRAIWTNNDLDMPVAVRGSIEKHLGRIPFWRER